KAIKYLSLNDSKVCGPGLVHLREMIHLDTLYLSRSAITDEGLTHLRDMTIAHETGRQAATLTRTPGPLAVVLDGTSISDAGLMHLSGVPVGFISLARTQISDSGLAELTSCPRLTALDVSHTQVSDKSLHSLSEFPALLWVNVTGTAVSVEAV